MKAAVKSMFAAVAASVVTGVFAAVPSSITKFVPETMNYQGYLANPSTGTAYADGIYTLDCRLYRSSSGGTAIWGASYSVYVKGGYFNIMLGDSAGQAVKSTVTGTAATTYTPTELWKALWYDTAVSEKNNLWLGVTPHQGAGGATLSSLSEISPRQQLLAAPYAFRAQAAEYAEQSIGAFKVNGALTVTGSLSLPSSFQFGHIKDTSTQLTLGGTSNASSNPYIYGYANYMNLYAYYSMNFSTTSGGYNFTVPSGKSFVIKSAGNFAVTNTTTTMKTSGTTTIEAGTLKMKGALTYGQYSGTGFVKPFVLKKVNFHVSERSCLIESNGDYNWIVAGFDSDPVGSWNGELAECYTKLVSGKWYVYVKRFTSGSEEDTLTVHLLGIHRSISSDNR